MTDSGVKLDTISPIKIEVKSSNHGKTAEFRNRAVTSLDNVYT